MKKIISLVLATILVFSLIVPASAANETEVKHNEEPLVVVRGIDFAGLVKEDGSKALALDPFDIFNLILDLGIYNIRHDENAAAKSIINFANNLFSDLACDKEGNPLNAGVSIPKFLAPASELDLSGDQWADTAVGLFRSLSKEYDADQVYLYTFDWRKSPSALADDLKSFFDMVIEDTGATKLDVAACSMGGMITTAYIDKYGADIFDSVVYLSSAHNGADVVGSAFTGDLTIDGNILTDFLVGKIGSNFFLKIIVKILDFLGIIDALSRFVNDVIVTYKDLIYDEFLCETFATAFGLWALVPDEYYDDAVELFYGDKEGYDTARAEIAEIRDFVFSTEEIIAKLPAAGVKVSFVSHYNREQLPIYSKGYLHGDGVLETIRTSGYATVANYGATLTDEQIAGVPADLISPDKAVNAATCLYPLSTWYVNGAKHVGCKDGSDHTEFAIWLLTQDIQPTVYSNPAYPRFMKVDANENFIDF
ncbi:MAG: hypothetical protein IJN88_09230 [Clostridia bacterium]|nr:hypothetical protein [Clostridia bacterium]